MDLTVHDLPQSVHRTVHYAPLLPSSNTCTSHPHFYDCILCLHVVQTATPFLLPSHGCALHTINIYSVFTYRTSSTCNTFWKYTHGTNLVFIKYCVFFPLNVVIFLNFASSASALVFWRSKRSVRCTLTDTEGKQRKARVRNIFKIFGQKNTISKEYPVQNVPATLGSSTLPPPPFPDLSFRPLCLQRFARFKQLTLAILKEAKQIKHPHTGFK